MGLDSVELIVETEAYFGVAIPDELAATIGTISDMATSIALLRGLSSDVRRTAVHSRLLEQALQCLGADFPTATADTPLVQLGLLQSGQPVRHQLENCLQLKLPPAPTSFLPTAPNWLLRMFGPSQPLPRPPHWPRATLADFIDWLLSQHYQLLLPDPTTLYEVQRAVIGLTASKLGINILEIQLTDSFTNDLGID